LDFPEELARKTCVVVVKRVRFRFGAFPDLDDDDLISEGMLAALKAWPKYTPKSATNLSAAAPSSYIYTVAFRTLVDLYRTRSRCGKHETRATEDSHSIGDPEEIAEPESDDDLAQWVGMIYAKSVAHIVARGLVHAPRHAGLFKRTFSLAHLLTLVAIQKRMRLSCHAAAHLMATRPDVRHAMRLPRRPNAMLFSRASRSITRLRPKRTRTPQIPA
jgi:DNA-directed RNA polymerase specialized sigma24 family protein